MITLYDAQAFTPQGCICYNPHAINMTDNSTVPCDDTHCSRGDNLNCFTMEEDDEAKSKRVMVCLAHPHPALLHVYILIVGRYFIFSC